MCELDDDIEEYLDKDLLSDLNPIPSSIDDKQHILQGGTLNQQELQLHDYIVNMGEYNYVSGFTGIYQWYNNNEKAIMPKSVTLLGEYHANYFNFGNCTIQETSDPGPNNKPNITVIEMLDMLFRGTRKCIDFYLEDWLVYMGPGANQVQNMFDLGLRNWTINDIQPQIIPIANPANQRRYNEFTIRNLTRMLNTDLVPPPAGTERRTVKKYENVRAHSTEFRIVSRRSIILPYSISLSPGNDWLDFVDIRHKNIVAANILANPQPAFNRIMDLMYLLAGLTPPSPSINPTINNANIRHFLDSDDPNIIGILHQELVTIYYDILLTYYRLGNTPGHLGYIDTNTRTGLTQDVRDNIQHELIVLTRYMTKNYKNLKKIDTSTQDLYINFFSIHLNINNKILNLRRNYRFVLNNAIIISILRTLDVSLVDIYTITRSLKIFALNSQSRNLNPNSLCFNEFGFNNRNLMYYHGYAHTYIYYIFWQYFYNRPSDYSLSLSIDYNGEINFRDSYKFLSTKIIRRRQNGTRYIYTITDFRDQHNLLDQLTNFLYIELYNPMQQWYRNLYESEYRKYKDTENNIHIRNRGQQCIGNYNHILKKILINISKHGEERIKLYEQLFNKYDFSNFINNYQEKLGRIINNNFVANMPSIFRFLITTDYRLPIQRGLTINQLEDVGYTVVFNDNIYTRDDFINRMRQNNFLPRGNNNLTNDIKRLEGLVTSFISNNFLKNDITRLNFIKLITNIYNNSISRWINNRLAFLINNYRLAFGIAPGVVIDQQILSQYSDIVKIIYKGGMPLKILYSQLKKQFSIDIENKLDNLFGKVFTASDNDFTLKINTPYIYENGITPAERQSRLELYNVVYNEISFLNFIIIRQITNIFNNKNAQKRIFDFFKNDNYEQSAELKKIFKDINNKVAENIRPGYTFNNLVNNSFKLFEVNATIAYPSEQIDLIDNTYVNLKNIGVNNNNVLDNSRDSFMILNSEIPDLNNRNQQIINAYIDSIRRYQPYNWPAGYIPLIVKKIYVADEILDNISLDIYTKDNDGPFYASYNTQVQTMFSTFNLSRIKYNCRLFGTRNLAPPAPANIFFDVPGEVLDISIEKIDSLEIYQNVMPSHHDYENYEVLINNKKIMKYKSYSIKGFIEDLLKILFIFTQSQTVNQLQNINKYGMPWADNKYYKRLLRLCFLTFMEIYDVSLSNIYIQQYNLINLSTLYTNIKRVISNNTQQNNNINYINVCFQLLTLLYNEININNNPQFINRNIVLQSIMNDLIAINIHLGVAQNANININPALIINTPNLNNYVIFEEIRTFSGLFAFIYYICKMIIFYRIQFPQGNRINAEWNNQNASNFFKMLKNILDKIISLISDINNPNSILIGKPLNQINLESFI